MYQPSHWLIIAVGEYNMTICIHQTRQEASIIPIHKPPVPTKIHKITDIRVIQTSAVTVISDILEKQVRVLVIDIWTFGHTT